MWCGNCQQDVPGVAHAASGRIVCSRCQRPATAETARHAARVCDEGIALDEPAAAAMASAPPLRNDARSQGRMRNVGRQLRRPMAAMRAASPQFSPGRRYSPPRELFDQLEQITAPGPVQIAPQPTTAGRPRPRRTEAGQVLSWIIALAGALALVAGIGLIGWSLSANQMAHWNAALGLTLGGQGALILGLVLVVSRLWRSSRHAAGRLHDVHARLGQLQHTADALVAMRSGTAPAFYADLVRGASPQVLLANLKGQVDQLATRLGSGW